MTQRTPGAEPCAVVRLTQPVLLATPLLEDIPPGPADQAAYHAMRAIAVHE